MHENDKRESEIYDATENAICEVMTKANGKVDSLLCAWCNGNEFRSLEKQSHIKPHTQRANNKKIYL